MAHAPLLILDLRSAQHHPSSTKSLPTPQAKEATNTIAMALFKSNKNKSASAASTPAQTPRTSMQEQRPEQMQAKMTRDQALKSLMQVSMNNAAAGCYVR
ncbi:hypothetical protein BGX34_011701 [Mortierella sp. NVP85]|nr:hypothetical protein BGX34_011701 [Mortierella sp. NVP85]